jgi:transcriptional regulator with XRE-family HTH domain
LQVRRFDLEIPRSTARCCHNNDRQVYDDGMANDADRVLVAFGEFVRAQRRLAQVSQRNLAHMSGVSDSYLSQIERGHYQPSPQVVKALARAFGLDPKQLYTMLGFMDRDEKGSPGPTGVEEAIQLDTRLDAAKKDALIRVYRSFLSDK